MVFGTVAENINVCFSSGVVSKIASKSSATIKIGKDAFYKQKDMSLKEAYDYTSKIMTENMLHKDSEEGITAFLEKRSPNWKD